MRPVTVIVLNWNGKALLQRCLDALYRQTYAPVDIWVVDNGSTDGSADWVRAHASRVTLWALPENLGFCRAYNLALRHVTTPYVALLNNDAFPSPLWLEALVQALEDHPRAWSAASKMVFHEDPQRIDRAGDAYGLEGAGWMRGRHAPASHFDRKAWVFGACAGAALYRTSVMRDLGYFDEDFFILHEDVDLSFRAQLRGYGCVFVPEALVCHHGSASVGRESAGAVYYGQRNVEWVYVKNMPTPLLAVTWPLHFLYIVGAGLYFCSRGRCLEFIKAKRDAYATMHRLLEKRKRLQRQRKISTRELLRVLDFGPLLHRVHSKVGRSSAPNHSPALGHL